MLNYVFDNIKQLNITGKQTPLNFTLLNETVWFNSEDIKKYSKEDFSRVRLEIIKTISVLFLHGYNFISLSSTENISSKSDIENMLNINKKQIHILHTDDDKFILDLYKPLFEKEGYKVSSIKELAKDFIQQVINLNPDLIISDITKPDVDGINFLKSLRANEKTKNIPFVFLSNSINEKVKEETKGLGVLGYFIKNRLTPNETVGSIKTLCVNLAKN